ncbi:MAG: hypothetical protein EOO27_07085, partial [Comamonadaceae bacterium]
EVTEQGKTYTYPQPTDAASASTPGSRFKRRGGSVLLRRGQAWTLRPRSSAGCGRLNSRRPTRRRFAALSSSSATGMTW